MNPQEVARACAEVAIGMRPPGQLKMHVDRDELARLARRGQAVLRHPSSRAQQNVARIRKVTGVRACVVAAGVVETSAVLLGDELDSPRGRIYLIKDMLENQRKPGPETVKHIDRCLSCLSCMTTCPSGVNYMHLVDHARAYIHENYGRPWHERALRRLLAWVLPYPGRFRAALLLARLGRDARELQISLSGLDFRDAPTAEPERGETLLEGYELDGTLLWRINLGRNIREGAHYTQFMVYALRRGDPASGSTPR